MRESFETIVYHSWSIRWRKHDQILKTSENTARQRKRLKFTNQSRNKSGIFAPRGYGVPTLPVWVALIVSCHERHKRCGWTARQRLAVLLLCYVFGCSRDHRVPAASDRLRTMSHRTPHCLSWWWRCVIILKTPQHCEATEWRECRNAAEPTPAEQPNPYNVFPGTSRCKCSRRF